MTRTHVVLIVIAIFVVVILGTGIGMVYKESSLQAARIASIESGAVSASEGIEALEDGVKNVAAKIDTLEEGVVRAEQRIDVLEKSVLPQKSAVAATPTSDKSIRLTAPTTGSTHCLNKPMAISWEGKGYENITLRLITSDGFYYDIGRYPLTFNESNQKDKGEVRWTVAGAAYRYPAGQPKEMRAIAESYANSIEIWGSNPLDGSASVQTAKINNLVFVRCQG